MKGVNNNATQHLLYNAGPNDCFVSHSIISANAVAVVPVAGTPSAGFPVPVGAVLVLSFPPDAFFAAITASTKTATLYLTPGEGN